MKERTKKTRTKMDPKILEMG